MNTAIAWNKDALSPGPAQDAVLKQVTDQMTEKGFVVAGREYEVDCIIYASGFEVGTEYRRRAGFDLTGRDGVKLSEAWGEGMRSLHGIHVHDFPNAFFVQHGLFSLVAAHRRTCQSSRR